MYVFVCMYTYVCACAFLVRIMPVCLYVRTCVCMHYSCMRACPWYLLVCLSAYTIICSGSQYLCVFCVVQAGREDGNTAAMGIGGGISG